MTLINLWNVLVNLWNVLVLVFIPSSVFILAISLLVFLFGKYLGKINQAGFALILFSFATVGGVVGVATGASRTSVIGEALPAILTVFTLMLGYMFTNESTKQYRSIIPYCLIVLMLTSLFGMFSGSSIRGKHEKFQREYDKWLLYYKEVELPIEKKKIENENKHKYSSGVQQKMQIGGGGSHLIYPPMSSPPLEPTAPFIPSPYGGGPP